MFVKITKSGPRRYVKLVESFRDEAGKSRQRVIATLGRLEAVTAGESSALINGLLRVSGQPTLDEGTGETDFAPARSVGDTWLLTSLWKELGLDDAFRRVLRTKRQFDAERLLRVMVFNRLCDPESKLGVLRWLEDVLVPDVDTASITHQHLLRTMDTLSECSETLNDVLAQQLKPLIDQELSIVFYDLTTIRSEGGTSLEGDVRHYGPSKEGGIARQFMLGVVQTAEGLPIHHEVFDGNMAETRTLLPTIETVTKRFKVRRVVLVADRGLLSLDNLEALSAVRIEGRPLEFILAVPGRRYGEFDELLKTFHQTHCQGADHEAYGEMAWQGHRLIVAHRPEAAKAQTAARDQKIEALQADARQWFEKLDNQDAGRRYRGRKLSDPGVTARFYKAVTDAHLGHILKVDLTAETFNYVLDQRALNRARMMDGKLLLVTNMADHEPEQIVERYRALADIERGFRVLKSDIEIAPVYHRLPERIRAHALICFLALVLYRVLRMRLKASDHKLSPTRALEIARKIQFHQVLLHRRETASGLTKLKPEQRDLFEAIGLPAPAASRL
ncbi:MAG: IS1634 family transposase [Halomonas sp.]|uniref:IS1634 family transposase n=1 Tax=Halomonas sp. TaxID=1486246 RepID=UPI002ACDD158|nr:IS1634 family transposase [Halomonas sp.]MDZ7853503.1 IS1634 family transposase [Halomonas sp.]